MINAEVRQAKKPGSGPKSMNQDSFIGTGRRNEKWELLKWPTSLVNAGSGHPLFPLSTVFYESFATYASRTALDDV